MASEDEILHADIVKLMDRIAAAPEMHDQAAAGEWTAHIEDGVVVLTDKSGRMRVVMPIEAYEALMQDHDHDAIATDIDADWDWA